MPLLFIPIAPICSGAQQSDLGVVGGIGASTCAGLRVPGGQKSGDLFGKLRVMQSVMQSVRSGGKPSQAPGRLSQSWVRYPKGQAKFRFHGQKGHISR